MGLVEVIDQFLVGPVGPVQPLLGWSLDDPAPDLVSQGGRDLGGSAFGLAWAQSVQALVQVGILANAGRYAE